VDIEESTDGFVCFCMCAGRKSSDDADKLCAGAEEADVVDWKVAPYLVAHECECEGGGGVEL
jgi:hypothetical protein